METETFQQQALLVRLPDENFDPTIEPQDGEEYLMKVIHERANCPAVVVKPQKTSSTNASLPNGGLSEDEIVDTSPRCLWPTIEWKRLQIDDFTRLREQVTLYRLKLQENGFRADDLPLPLTDESDQWKNFCQHNQPLLSILLRIDQRSLEKLIEFQSDWLQEEFTNGLIDLSVTENWIGSWIYATLACLHLPLEPNTHSVLRDIARLCIQFRNLLSPDDGQHVQPYNLFILLISKYFSQLDLSKYI